MTLASVKKPGIKEWRGKIAFVRINERTQTIVCWGTDHSRKESKNIQSLKSEKREAAGLLLKRIHNTVRTRGGYALLNCACHFYGALII